MAVSEKQLMANRQNALQSTGPRTVAGKGASAQNATRHGLRAEHTVIPGEDPAEFDRFRDQLFQELAPAGVLESRLTAQIAAASWKFQRVDRMESDLLRYLQDTHNQQRDKYAKKSHRRRCKNSRCEVFTGRGNGRRRNANPPCLV